VPSDRSDDEISFKLCQWIFLSVLCECCPTFPPMHTHTLTHTHTKHTNTHTTQKYTHIPCMQTHTHTTHAHTHTHTALQLSQSPSSVLRKTLPPTPVLLVSCYLWEPPSTWTVLHCTRPWQLCLLLKWTISIPPLTRLSSLGMIFIQLRVIYNHTPVRTMPRGYLWILQWTLISWSEEVGRDHVMSFLIAVSELLSIGCCSCTAKSV